MEGLDKEVEELFRESIEKLEKLGANVKEIDIPEGWELIGIENAHGALGNGQTVVATAKNQSTQKHGNIEVTKELIGDVSNKKFEFEIYINDKFKIHNFNFNINVS